jgi:putative transposase
MPAKHTIKIYAADSIYHIYNRGVEKRNIFIDSSDYQIFLHCLKEALLPESQLKRTLTTFTLKGLSFQGVMKPPKNFSNEVSLLAYCLMPNHFHLLIKQAKERSIDLFMRSISTRYAIYFNKKYKRVGHLFQGPYKASIILEEQYYLHISRYIHRNPLAYTKNLLDAYSSYADYLKKRETPWVKPEIILSSFGSSENQSIAAYKNFVELEESQEENSLQRDLTLESDTL